MSVLRKTHSLHRRCLLGLGVVVLAAGFASHADAGTSIPTCQAFPKVGVWKNLNHATMRDRVEREYSGDWQAYMGKLKGYADKLRRIQTKGKSVLVTRGGQKVRLQGQAFIRFLAHVDERIAVTRCLAENPADTLDAAGIADFPTAGGGNSAGNKGKTAEKQGPKKCRGIPYVSWWKFKTNKSVTGYVSRKYKGDWTPYIKSWNRRLLKLQKIHRQGSNVVTKNGITLKGKTLAGYIKKTQARIAITRCLAKKDGASKT